MANRPVTSGSTRTIRQITDTIDPGRRESSYFLPIAAPKKKSAPGLFDDLKEKKTESSHVNEIRRLVRQWSKQGWPDITPLTRALLEHWNAEAGPIKAAILALVASGETAST